MLRHPDFTGPRAELPTPQIFSIKTPTSRIQVGVSECLDITQKFLFTTSHLCTPESIWRSVPSCYWSWSQGESGGKQVAPQPIGHIQHQHPPPSSAGTLLVPGQDPHPCLDSFCLYPMTVPVEITCFLHAQVTQVSLQALHPAAAQDSKSFNKPYFFLFIKESKARIWRKKITKWKILLENILLFDISAL